MKVKNSTFSVKTLSARLFKLAMVFMMVCSFNLAKAQSDTIQINFGSSTAVPKWNSLGNFGVALEPTILNNTKGVATTIGLKVTGTFIANNTAGTTEPDPGIGIPASVSATNWYASRTSVNCGFLLSGMDPNKDYEVHLFGSIMRTDGNVREVECQFIGKEEVSLFNDATLNQSVVAIGQITPDAEGNIIVNCKTGPNNTNGGGNFHISAMRLIYANETTGLIPGKSNLSNVFPNPAKDIVNVEVAEPSQVRILDVTGKVLVEKTVEAGKNPLQLNLKSGLYLLQVAGKNKSGNTTKLIVE